MKKYNVTLYYHTSADVVVKARNEEEAIQKAYDKVDDDDLLNNLQEDDSPDVSEA